MFSLKVLSYIKHGAIGVARFGILFVRRRAKHDVCKTFFSLKTTSRLKTPKCRGTRETKKKKNKNTIPTFLCISDSLVGSCRKNKIQWYAIIRL